MTGKKISVNIIGFDSGWGCGDYGCQDGPYKIEIDQILHSLSTQSVTASYSGPLGLKFLDDRTLYKTKQETLPHVTTALNRLSAKVRSACDTGVIPVVIGGDHSCAIATWSAVTTSKNCTENFGLIWIDAHLDCHTHETSWQGKFGGWWHGQPLAALTGRGLPQFTALCGDMVKISPKNICIVGAHSFEPAEKDFIEKNGIKVIYLSDIEKHGFDAAFAQAIAIATNGTKGFGISIDLDAFGPNDAPGVGAAEEKGLKADEVIKSLSGAGRKSGFSALEIVEFNPHKDRDHKTAHLIEKILKSIFNVN